MQGGSDSFLRLYGYGMSGNSLFAFHKFLLECLVAYAFTDLAGFDGYAGPFSFFIGSRIDQSMIGLSLYRLVGLFHRYMEKAKQGFKLLDGLELVSLHDGLDHIGYLMLDIPLPAGLRITALLETKVIPIISVSFCIYTLAIEFSSPLTSRRRV